jgi:carboxyl-terminal processing protease
MARHFVFFTFVRDFLAKNPPVDTSFQVSDGLLEQFRQHLQKRNIDVTDQDFSSNKDFLKRQIRYEVIYNRLGVQEAARTLLDGDPVVMKAIELMPEARALAEKARQANGAKQ